GVDEGTRPGDTGALQRGSEMPSRPRENAGPRPPQGADREDPRRAELFRFLLDAHWRDARTRGLALALTEHHAAVTGRVRRVPRPGYPALDAGAALADLFLRLRGRVEKAPLYVDGSVRAYLCTAGYHQALTTWRRTQAQKAHETTALEVRGRLEQRL